MEDPSKVAGKQIVRRELVRIFTPGVHFDLEGAEANYIASLVQAGSSQTGSKDTWILSCLDASTGEALVSSPLPRQLWGQKFPRSPFATSCALTPRPWIKRSDRALCPLPF